MTTEAAPKTQEQANPTLEQQQAIASLATAQAILEGGSYPGYETADVAAAQTSREKVNGALAREHESVRNSPGMGRHLMHASSTPEQRARWAVQLNEEESRNLDNVAHMDASRKHLQSAVDTIANDGVTNNGRDVYVPGTSKTVKTEASTKGSYWERGTKGRYSIGKDGKVTRRTMTAGSQVGLAPTERVYSDWTPTEKNQERAAELVQALADKQGERSAEKERARNLENAQRTVQQVAEKQEAIKQAA